MEILDILKFGRANAVPRKQICQELMVSDAVFRGEVEKLQNQGYLICNMADGKGYFIAETRKEYNDYRKFKCSYAKTILQTLWEMDKSAENKFNENYRIEETQYART